MPYKDPHSKAAVESMTRRRKKYQSTLHGSFAYRFHRMKRRSLDTPGNKDYVFYKDFKSEWTTLDEFRSDMWNSFLEHVDKYGVKNTSLERVDNLKGYSRQNCRWATRQEQACNRRARNTVSINGRL